jgi:hypothetical protein
LGEKKDNIKSLDFKDLNKKLKNNHSKSIMDFFNHQEHLISNRNNFFVILEIIFLIVFFSSPSNIINVILSLFGILITILFLRESKRTDIFMKDFIKRNIEKLGEIKNEYELLYKTGKQENKHNSVNRLFGHTLPMVFLIIWIIIFIWMVNLSLYRYFEIGINF